MAEHGHVSDGLFGPVHLGEHRPEAGERLQQTAALVFRVDFGHEGDTEEKWLVLHFLEEVEAHGLVLAHVDQDSLVDQEAPLAAHALELLEVEGSLVLGCIPDILEGQHTIDLFLDFPEPWLPQRSEALV